VTSVSAGAIVLRHCDLDFSRTAVESKSNRSCNHRIMILVVSSVLSRLRVVERTSENGGPPGSRGVWAMTRHGAWATH